MVRLDGCCDRASTSGADDDDDDAVATVVPTTHTQKDQIDKTIRMQT